MEYKLFSLPYLPQELDFRVLTTAQARENFEAFVPRIAERLHCLTFLIQLEHPEWRADLSEMSLAVLGEWYARHVEQRGATEKEMNSLRRGLGPLADLAEVSLQFTPMTLSIGVDIGIYIGECIRMRCPASAWKLQRRMKQPVVAGTGLARGEEYPPIPQARNLAEAVATQKQNTTAKLSPGPTHPSTLAEAHLAALRSIPQKDPRTMLCTLVRRCVDPEARAW